MPAAFDRCVKNGGRVRTKKLEGNKYIHICFLGGKSYVGEVKTKQTEDGEEMKRKKKLEQKPTEVKFTESLTFSFTEANIDEAKRTVKVCALAPCISRNNRFFSPAVVESASGKLVGLKSFADHDYRDTQHLVGRIVAEDFKDGKLFADIRLSKARGIAKETFEKLLDGTITDVSIAADGTTKRMKLGDKYVDEVTKLDIRSVDFVTEGGVPDAKVMRVFENVKDIPTLEEVEKEMTIETLEQLQEQYPDLVTEANAPLQKEVDELKKELETAKFKLVEKEMAAYKETKIAALKVNDKIKDILRKKVTGKTKEEVDTNIASELALAKSYEEAYKVEAPEAKIEGVPEKKKKEEEKKEGALTSKIIRALDVTEAVKGIAIEKLWNDGAEAAKAFLKTHGVEL